MNARTVGQFILELRKEKGITQKELADHLHISDKTISRWETGKGYPDVSILHSLANYFGITITELLSGTRLSEKEFIEQSEDLLMDSLHKQKNRNIVDYLIYIVIAIALIIYMGLMTGEYNNSLEVLVVFVSIIAILDQVKPRNKKILCLLVSFIVFVIIGGFTIRTEQYNNGKYIGYALGNKMNVQDYINIQEYANSICPYEYGSNEWKGFIMGFIEGVDER